LIVGSGGAMLIETLLNRRLHAQVRGLVRQKAAGLPLLYAVNSWTCCRRSSAAKACWR
jgi:cyclase